MTYAKHLNSKRKTMTRMKKTSQSEKIPGTTQVKNSAGGFSWAVDEWKQLDRFLILGSEGGTYYASEQKLTKDNAKSVLKCLKQDGTRTVNRIVEISKSGRAPKNNPAIFALAMAIAFGDKDTKRLAGLALPKVARIGTDLFTFLAEAQELRGWGRVLRNAVANWYTSQDVNDLAYQVCKYNQRNGWTHRDALRLGHPKTSEEVRNNLFNWIVKGESYPNLPIISSYTQLKNAKSEKEVVKLIEANRNVSWEMVPSDYLGEQKVWEALLPNLPMRALTRNLARMTANGLLTSPLSNASKMVVEKLTSKDLITKSRLHPIAILGALCTYSQGKGNKGNLTWTPNQKIVDALNQAFYLSFGNVTPTGKNFMLGIDISGSMSGGEVGGMAGLSPAKAAAAMAMVTARTESNYEIRGFANTFRDLNISPSMRLEDVLRVTEHQTFGGTDCALPMIYALQHKIPVDTFVVYTDSETRFGNMHPSQALTKYRNEMGINSKLIVCGMVSNKFTIADPNDAGMLDVVGFDTATPQLISDFSVN